MMFEVPRVSKGTKFHFPRTSSIIKQPPCKGVLAGGSKEGFSRGDFGGSVMLLTP